MTYKIKNDILPNNRYQSAKTAFDNRNEYDKAINNIKLAKTFDFSSSENGLYTRANLTRDFVQPLKNKLNVITENKNKQITAINFVVDAFEDFRVFLKNKKFKKLVDDPIIKKDWRAEVGFEDIDIFYDQKMGEIYQSFVTNYLLPSGKEKEIRNFDDFLKIFMNDFYRRVDTPLTKSGFVQSRFIGPQFSGLCIQISKEDSSGYSNKYNKFVNSKNFETFSLAAAQFGFMLDYHVPWRLVANLNSPKLYPYILDRVKIANLKSATNGSFGNIPDHTHEYEMDQNLNGKTTSILDSNIPDHIHEIKNGAILQAQYYDINLDGGFTNTTHMHDITYVDNSFLKTSDIYNIYFYQTSFVDMQVLKSYLIDMYNTFVSNFPASVITKTCINNKFVSILNGQDATFDTVTREHFGLEDLGLNYSDVFWYKLYFNIRLKEVNAKITNLQVSSAIKKMEEYYFSVDEIRAMRYINNYVKQFY